MQTFVLTIEVTAVDVVCNPCCSPTVLWGRHKIGLRVLTKQESMTIPSPIRRIQMNNARIPRSLSEVFRLSIFQYLNESTRLISFNIHNTHESLALFPCACVLQESHSVLNSDCLQILPSINDGGLSIAGEGPQNVTVQLVTLKDRLAAFTLGVSPSHKFVGVFLGRVAVVCDWVCVL